MKCNTVTFTAADGKKTAFPLDELLERGAVVASKVNGEDIAASMGAFNQLWVPGLPAKYYVRDIVGIEFAQQENPPRIEPFDDDGHDYTNRPNISLHAPFTCKVGEPIRLEGYADDFDRAIRAVQLSFDQGDTWTTFSVSDATPERWVYWHFDYTPQAAGLYQAKARAVNEEGTVSPVAAVHTFEAVE